MNKWAKIGKRSKWSNGPESKNDQNGQMGHKRQMTKMGQNEQMYQWPVVKKYGPKWSSAQMRQNRVLMNKWAKNETIRS